MYFLSFMFSFSFRPRFLKARIEAAIISTSVVDGNSALNCCDGDELAKHTTISDQQG
jgi:hypothetical protein